MKPWAVLSPAQTKRCTKTNAPKSGSRSCSQSAARSIRRGLLFDVVDHKHRHGPLLFLQLQSQLILECIKQRYSAARIARRPACLLVVTSRRRRKGSIDRAEREGQVIRTLKPGSVGNRIVDVSKSEIRKQNSQLLQRYILAVNEPVDHRIAEPEVLSIRARPLIAACPRLWIALCKLLIHGFHGVSRHRPILP